MEAGHGGASGRFKRIHDTALEYSFFYWLTQQRLISTSKHTPLSPY
jgi:oligopeptidase B